MRKQRIILISLVCFLVAVFAVQVVSWANNTSQPPTRWWLSLPPREMLRGLSDEERAKVIEQWSARLRQQERESNEARRTLIRRQAWTRLLRITEQQWEIIEPKADKVPELGYQANAGAGHGGRDEQSFHWKRPSDHHHPMEGKSRDQMPGAYRAVEELLDVIEDANSTDQQIREKIDALHLARQKAREAYPKAQHELAAVLTTPREEAVFLILRYID